MSFSPMKIKAFVLTAGLLAFGANGAWALTTCKTNLDGQTRTKGSKCTSKSYKFNTNRNCTCPGDNPAATMKCLVGNENPNFKFGESYDVKYSCEVPR